MCKINSGETVCDPMCGGGSIPIEVMLTSYVNYSSNIVFTEFELKDQLENYHDQL